MVQCITVKLVEREKVASAHVRISKHAKQLFSTTLEKILHLASNLSKFVWIELPLQVKHNLPGGGVSWMLFLAHHPTGKIFLELELHHMEGRLPSPQLIKLSISTWKKISLATFDTVAAHIEEGSFGFTASSFNPVVKP